MHNLHTLFWVIHSNIEVYLFIWVYFVEKIIISQKKFPELCKFQAHPGQTLDILGNILSQAKFADLNVACLSCIIKPTKKQYYSLLHT